MALNAIKAIDKSSVAKICSGQVILDLSTAVKELVENALDAGATTVEVRLKDHGLQLIEVADNGRGVQPKDYEALALKYHTSKLSDFSDLEGLHTFGFRGEALSSLAALSDLSVITRTAEQAAATRLEFDRHGKLVGKSTCARGVGTTVVIKDLFATLPVRRQDLQKNVRREVSKLKLLLQQYAILSGQSQLFASDQAGKAARTTLVSTGNSGPGLRDRVSAVLGAKVATLLQPLEFELPAEGVKVTGLVSRASCGVKGDKLRQFCCINGRPVEVPRAIKTLNETYKSLYSSLVGLKPLAFLCFNLPAGTFDVNVTPDKRSVFIQKEVAIMAALGQALQALWEPSRYTYTVNPSTQTYDTNRGSAAATTATQAGGTRGGYAPAPAAAAGGGGGDGDGDGDDDATDSDDDTGVGAQVLAEDAAAPPGAGVGSSSQRQRPAAGPPSLMSFMAGGLADNGGTAVAAAGVQSAAGQQRQQQQQHQPEVEMEREPEQEPEGNQQLLQQRTQETGAAAGSLLLQESSNEDPAAAAVGSKRSRPLEAALLGRLAKPRHGASSSSKGGTAGSEGEDDSDDSDGQENDAVGSRQQQRILQPQWQPQQGNGQQPAGGPDLAAFALGGSVAEPLASQQQRQSPGPADRSGKLHQQGSNKAASSSDRSQRSLSAFGFKNTMVQPQRQQQQQQCNAAAAEQEPSSHRSVPVAQQADDKDGAADTAELCNKHEHESAAAAPGAEAYEDSGVEIVEDDNLQLMGLSTAEQQQDEFQQLKQPTTAAAAASAEPPVVLQYDMQQLMADVQLKLQLTQQQQQQQAAQGLAAGSKLAAASLQGTAAAATADDCDGGAGHDDIEPQPATTADAANAAATAELARVFDKGDFAVMQPVGQFNLGFIVARLGQDLFIVDQHAADEKSTFERLMGDYTVNKQPLLHPRKLHTLTYMDQQVIREYIDVFKRNGFDFVDANQHQQHASNVQQQQLYVAHDSQGAPPHPAEGSTPAAADAAILSVSGHLDYVLPGDAFTPPAADGDQPAGTGDSEDACGALLLSAVPLVRGSGAAGVLGEEVLVELLDLIAAGERRAEDLRPKRVRDMLASRACRTSIMIGSHLTRQQQQRILARLAKLDAPWNCPHGRPTMRHLAVLPQRSVTA